MVSATGFLNHGSEAVGDFDIEVTSMLRLTRSFAALVLAATLTPVAAYAWPLGKALHMHPADEPKDGRVTVHVFNYAPIFRDIKVDGQTYTILPHHEVAVTAPAGTQIFAGSSGYGYHRGDLLATVSPETSKDVVALN